MKTQHSGLLFLVVFWMLSLLCSCQAPINGFESETQVETDTQKTWEEVANKLIPPLNIIEDPVWEKKLSLDSQGNIDVYEGKIYENGKYLISLELNFDDLADIVSQLQKTQTNIPPLTSKEYKDLCQRIYKQRFIDIYVDYEEDVFFNPDFDLYLVMYASSSDIEHIAKCPHVSSIRSGDAFLLPKLDA